jgi:hypothetical protein
MRFEVVAAYIMGIVLPLLEVMRRRSNFEDIPAYVDDFLIGAFLLYAARAVTLRQPKGRVLLVAAWAVFCGGLYNSFFGQLSNANPNDLSGYSNALVVGIKGILYLIAITGLVLSIRATTPDKR